MSDRDDGYRDVPKHTLPVVWSNGQTQIRDRSVVATPSKQDVAQYGDQRRVTCASCRHFRHEAGQRAMGQERFLERLVIEEQWKLKHLGSSPKDMGFCQEHGRSTLTSLHAAACDHYSARSKGMIIPGENG